MNLQMFLLAISLITGFILTEIYLTIRFFNWLIDEFDDN